MQSPPKSRVSIIEQFCAWLAGAGLVTLRQCPDWEQRKHAVYGATVLVPTLFGAAASGYAASTLTSNPLIIALIALAWGFVVLTIDRAFLASYRSGLPPLTKAGQFFLRFVIAVLMGMTIAHPLVLLIFDEAVKSEIAEEHSRAAREARSKAVAESSQVDGQIAGLQERQSELRRQYQATFQPVVTAEQPDPLIAADDHSAQLALIDHQIATQSDQRNLLQEQITKWQQSYEAEVAGNGISGIAGIGPEARRILNDELAWRQEDLRRISEELTKLAAEKSRLIKAINDRNLSPEQQELAAARAQAQIERLKSQSQSQAFLREDLQKQITAISDEILSLQTRKQRLLSEADEKANTDPPSDLITATLALHRLFSKEGGSIALTTYIVLSLIFVIMDTIPIVVKFTAKPGPYEMLIEYQETNFRPEGESGDDSPIPEEDPPTPKSVPRYIPRWKKSPSARKRLKSTWTTPPSERRNRPESAAADSVSDASPEEIDLSEGHVIANAFKLAEMRQVFRTNGELAEAVGIKPATLSKYFKLLKSPDEVQAQMAAIPDLTLEIAYRIACVDDREQCEALLNLCAEGASQRAIREAIADLRKVGDDA